MISVFVKLDSWADNTHCNYADDGTLNYFNVDRTLIFGSQKYNEAILSSLTNKGERNKIVDYVLNRATELGIGVKIYFQAAMFITWLERNTEGKIVEKQIMIEFDSNKRPIRIATGSNIVGKWPKDEIYIAPPSLIDVGHGAEGVRAEKAEKGGRSMFVDSSTKTAEATKPAEPKPANSGTMNPNTPKPKPK